MAMFMPGARISQAHGTVRPVDPATGAAAATVFAMYHPAAALRTPAIERESYADIAAVPVALIDSRRRREAMAAAARVAAPIEAAALEVETAPAVDSDRADVAAGAVDDVAITDDLAAAIESAVSMAADDPAEPQLTLF
jgi:hypothetical protein